MLVSASILVRKKIQTHFTPEARLVFKCLLGGPPKFALAVLFGDTRPRLPSVALMRLGGAIGAGLGRSAPAPRAEARSRRGDGHDQPNDAAVRDGRGLAVWSETPGLSAALGAVLVIGETLFAVGLAKQSS